MALANYARLRGRGTAEVAFAVDDELQRRGIGTRLLEQLAERAAPGIERFVALVLPDNRQMLRVFEPRVRASTRELDGGEIEVAFPIAPTELLRGASTDVTTSASSLRSRPFFPPRTVAVVGASRRRGTIGGELFRNVLARRVPRRRVPGQP